VRYRPAFPVARLAALEDGREIRPETIVLVKVTSADGRARRAQLENRPWVAERAHTAVATSCIRSRQGRPSAALVKHARTPGSPSMQYEVADVDEQAARVDGRSI
jgi:hypothetical protein